MNIDKNKIYFYQDYSYKNFITLSEDELKMVLYWRNSPEVRRWMMSTSPIKLAEHLEYVEKLKIRSDVFYWLIMRESVPVGVLNITNVDFNTKTGEPGFYLSPDLLHKGEGIFVLQNYKAFLLDILGFEQLPGHNYIENTNALQLSLFFGAAIDGIIEKDNRKYVSLCLKKNQFKHHKKEKLILNFVKYSKENPILVDKILSDYKTMEDG